MRQGLIKQLEASLGSKPSKRMDTERIDTWERPTFPFRWWLAYSC